MIDEKTLSDIYDRHHHELFVYILGFTRIPEVAEDYLHDAFVRLIRYSQKYPIDQSNIRAFLYRTARNICIDHARRSRKIDIGPLRDEIVSATADPEGDAALRELQGNIDALVDSRDQVSRSVYIMKTELDMPYQEIAGTLGISERTAKRKMRSMLEYLAESLEKAGFKLIMFILVALLAILFVIYR